MEEERYNREMKEEQLPEIENREYRDMEGRRSVGYLGEACNSVGPGRARE